MRHSKIPQRLTPNLHLLEVEIGEENKTKFHFLKDWISALRNFDCMEIFPSNSPCKRPPRVRSIMVIELSGDVSGMHLVWNHTRDFKIGRASSASSTWNHKSDLRSKLHDVEVQLTLYYSHIQSEPIFYWPSSRFVEKRKQKSFLHLLHRYKIKKGLHPILYLKQKWCDIE